MPHSELPEEERFWLYVQKTPRCWLWTGSLTTYGYAQLRVHGRKMGAHRYSYLLARGTIPDGLQVCHKCDVRHCVNPEHLFLGTAVDNMQDALKKGRFRPREYRANPVIPIAGELVCASEAGRRIGLSESGVRYRLRVGRPVAASRHTPDVFLHFDDKTLNIKQWAEHLGISEGAIHGRRNKGWPIERVLAAHDFRAAAQ